MKVVTLSEAISLIHSGDKVGISGFLGVGEPFELIAVSYTHLTLPTTPYV